MKFPYLKLSLILPACLFMAACSDDDEPQMPANTITLNMMIGNNGTTIGNTDVYINSSGNFTSDYCFIADFGKRGWYSNNPDLSQLAHDVAVTPGNFYQIIRSGDISIVAGARAVPVNASFYNAFVDSWIYDRDNDVAGAKISYVECTPETNALPEWNARIDLRLESHDNTETAEYTFPNGCQIDNNIEVSDFEDSYMKDRLEIELHENRISFSNSSWTPGGKVRVRLLVRYESIYSRVYLDVESSD